MFEGVARRFRMKAGRLPLLQEHKAGYDGRTWESFVEVSCMSHRRRRKLYGDLGGEVGRMA